MKKVIFLLFCILFLTGCNVTYNVDLDSFDENTLAVCGDFGSSLIVTDGMTERELYDYYLKKEVPYYYDQMVYSQTNVRFDGVSYYDVNNYDGHGLSFDAHFKDITNYSKSRLLWSAVANKNISENNNVLSVNASNFILFKSYKNVDELTVNITSKYKVINSNADKVNGKVYTWVIDRDNYDSKVINISFNTGSVLDDVARSLENDPMLKFTTVLGVLGLISLIIYLVTKRIFAKRNKF